MLTRSNLIGIPRVIDHNDPTDVHFFLDCFEKYWNTTDKRKLPDEIRWYGRALYAQDALKGRDESASLEKVSHQIPGTQAHVPDTYVSTFGHVIFIIGFHYPLTSKRGRPMQLDDSYNFCEPLLRQFADIWIGKLARNGFNRRVAQCLVYSSILILDLLPISGSSDWAAKENVDGKCVVKSHTYRWALEQTRQPVKTMLKYIVNELCVGVFVVRNAASEAYPCLLKGTHFEDDGVLNNNVSHTCKVRLAAFHPTEQAAWINESAEVLLLVVDEANPIRSEVVLDRDELVYVHPNKVRAEEYSHLPLEQCKHVYEDLVNQYKSLAKKIDERIHWRELDNTANQLSAERHKLNYRLQELEDEEEKRDREERMRVAKQDKEKREEKSAREAKRDKEKREEERAREAKRDKEEKEERARVAKREKEERKESEERSRVKREEERVRVIHQKIEGGKEITIYVNTRAIVSKLGTIKLVGNSRDSILRVKSKLESVVGVTTHEMIISNASDEDMSDKKSLAMCKVAMGSFIIIKRRS